MSIVNKALKEMEKEMDPMDFSKGEQQIGEELLEEITHQVSNEALKFGEELGQEIKHSVTW